MSAFRQRGSCLERLTWAQSGRTCPEARGSAFHQEWKFKLRHDRCFPADRRFRGLDLATKNTKHTKHTKKEQKKTKQPIENKLSPSYPSWLKL